jgi:type I restriction enzyme S subunit
MFGDSIPTPKGWKKDKLHNLLGIERGGSPRTIERYITDDENEFNWIKIGDAAESVYIKSIKEKIRQRV